MNQEPDKFTQHFDHHNAEPEEMLMVKRSDIINRYKAILAQQDLTKFGYSAYLKGQKELLESLYGSKCVPDKEEQAKPKFEVGQFVRCLLDFVVDKPLRIVNYDSADNQYQLEGMPILWVDENQIEPYTEEKNDNMLTEEDPDIAQKLPYLEHLSKQKEVETKNDMEEKELNLCELLKGCEGEELFTIPYGELFLGEINEDYLILKWDGYCGQVNYHHNGKLYTTGEVTLYPSRALYEKYPLDAKKAWAEWVENKKPKRWRAKQGESHWFIEPTGEISYGKDNYFSDCDNCWMFGNYFRTASEAKQAAEEVRKTLESFHKRKEGEK